jgi:Domain of unknown function (DUF4381)
MSEPVSGAHGVFKARVFAAFLGLLICAAPYAATSPVGSGDSSEDIRDIRGPKSVSPAWLLPALLAGGVLIIAGGYGVWRWQRRRRRPPALLPYEIALRRLEEIRVLMLPAKAREFSIAVSDIVRNYIELGFEVTATRRTTEEFLHDLLETTNLSLSGHRALLAEFLHQCDFVKFAGMSLTLRSMESLHHSACAFVRETAKPKELPEIHEEAHDSLPST